MANMLDFFALAVAMVSGEELQLALQQACSCCKEQAD